jgi:hypothetical protein
MHPGLLLGKDSLGNKKAENSGKTKKGRRQFQLVSQQPLRLADFCYQMSENLCGNHDAKDLNDQDGKG